MTEKIRKKKIFIVEGVDRIGKSSVAIPAIKQALFWNDVNAKILNSEYSAHQFNELIKNIEKPTCIKSALHSISDLSTITSQYALFNNDADAIIIDRLHISTLAYAILFDRFTGDEIADIDDIVQFYDELQLAELVKYFAETIDSLFDVHVLIFTWADDANCHKDEKLTIEQSRRLNNLFIDLYKKYFENKPNYHLFKLANDDNKKSDIEPAIMSFLENNKLLISRRQYAEISSLNKL